MAEQEKTGFWDYFTPIATGIGSAAITGVYNNYIMKKQNEFNAQQAEINRQWNAAEAEKNRQYETQMSNTAYQRGYTDMAAAGLNPHLAGGQGGASTPAGGMGTSTAATSAGMLPLDINGAVNAASNAALLKSQINNLEAGTQKTLKETGKTEAETKGIEIDNDWKDMKNWVEIALQTAQTKREKELANFLVKQADKAEKEISKIDYEIDILKSEGKIKEAEAKTITRNRRLREVMDRIEQGTRIFSNTMAPVTKMQEQGTKAINAFAM